MRRTLLDNLRAASPSDAWRIAAPARTAARSVLEHASCVPACLFAVLAIATSPRVANADGVYLSGSVGPGAVRDQLGSSIDGTFRERTAIGLRFGNWALEPFFASESTGNPAPWAQPTLTSYGIDLKRIFPIAQHVSAYVRGSMSHLAYPTASPCCYAEPLFVPSGGDYYGYSGRGLGLGVGAQASVKILGMRAGVFIDEGYDYYRLLPPSGDTYATHVDGSITRLTIGLAVGTDF